MCSMAIFWLVFLGNVFDCCTFSVRPMVVNHLSVTRHLQALDVNVVHFTTEKNMKTLYIIRCVLLLFLFVFQTSLCWKTPYLKTQRVIYRKSVYWCTDNSRNYFPLILRYLFAHKEICDSGQDSCDLWQLRLDASRLHRWYQTKATSRRRLQDKRSKSSISDKLIHLWNKRAIRITADDTWRCTYFIISNSGHTYPTTQLRYPITFKTTPIHLPQYPFPPG